MTVSFISQPLTYDTVSLLDRSSRRVRREFAYPDAQLLVEQLAGAARLLLRQPGGIEQMQVTAFGFA
jgi:hypothetical protein